MGRKPSQKGLGEVFRPYIKHPRQISEIERLASLLSDHRMIDVNPSEVVCEALSRDQSLSSWIQELEGCSTQPEPVKQNTGNVVEMPVNDSFQPMTGI